MSDGKNIVIGENIAFCSMDRISYFRLDAYASLANTIYINLFRMVLHKML